MNKENIKDFLKKITTDEGKKYRNIINITFSILSFIAIFMLLYIPICVLKIDDEETVIKAIGWFSETDGDVYLEAYKDIQMVGFFLILIFLGLGLYNIVKGFLNMSNEKKLCLTSKKSIITSIVITSVYTVFTWVFSPINASLGGHTVSKINLFPLIFILIVCVIYAVYNSYLTSQKNEEVEVNIFEEEEKQFLDSKRNSIKGKRIELLVYSFISVVVSLLSLLMRIITVKYEVMAGEPTEFIIKGWKLITDTESITTQGQRMMAYLIFVFLIINLVVLFLSILSFINKSKFFYKISLSTIVTGAATTLLVGLYAQYFKIAQGVNMEFIGELIGIVDFSSIVECEIESGSLIYFLISLLLLVALFISRPYSKATSVEAELETIRLNKIPRTINFRGGGSSFGGSKGGTVELDYDACPAFTEIDNKRKKLQSELEVKKQSLFEEPSLPKLVDFIVQYARDSRLHLYYTHEEIATFIAGLGTTKLAILQGMSGTGKTSLPKIVSEALYSVCDIVEVESSWRDKNELLGYYNEFNKVYTPKKFTQALYKAKLNSEVLTFIVLDEMNLSRIEYYFSDFLSLMENEPDKREIKLVNVGLFNENGEYKGLTDGHTLKIPNNVWFIGTANRDESTYDISDKVYDRAYTMNFDKRATKVQSYGNPLNPKFISANDLNNLFEDAKQKVNFNIDQNQVISNVEKLLAPYNISFGNRIANQIEDFVKVYSSCFAVTDSVINDALEIILLSKVVRKLELKNIDDKDSLAEEFANLNLMRCSKFITNLKED